MTDRPMTAAERQRICLALARKDFANAQAAHQGDWIEYWTQHSWNYLLVWGALKQGIDV